MLVRLEATIRELEEKNSMVVNLTTNLRIHAVLSCIGRKECPKVLQDFGVDSEAT